jgi:F1F0 ATPase subunit 2
MTPREIETMGAAFICGLPLGALYFGGLWWTICRAVASNSPALWFLGSLLLRTLAVMAAFYWVSQGDWRRLLSCLFGFLMARFAIQRLGSRPKGTGAPLSGRATS